MNTHEDVRLDSKLYHYAADVTKVYDGDTITVNLDLGMGIWRNGQTIRLWKINTPEVRGSEREEGIRVRDMVRDLILNKSILLRTILDKRGEDRTGKYGRLLGEVLVPNARGALINVNDLLLGLGMAVPMGADGSRARAPQARSASAATTQPIPETISCPFCGEVRQIHKELLATAGAVDRDETVPTTASDNTIIVDQCPNCLDQAHPLGGF